MNISIKDYTLNQITKAGHTASRLSNSSIWISSQRHKSKNYEDILTKLRQLYRNVNNSYSDKDILEFVKMYTFDIEDEECICRKYLEETVNTLNKILEK